MSETVSPAVEKDALRREALAKRDLMPAAFRMAAAESAAARDFPIALSAPVIVSAFMPMRSEINPLPLMRRLSQAGASLALPVVIGRGSPLLFRAWAFGAPLVAGVWGIKQPAHESPVVEPDILIVPLAAFDRAGHRIGYGAGYYDLTINALRAKKSIVAIGLAFSAQEIAHVPATSTDARLDLVLTERETIDLRSSDLRS